MPRRNANDPLRGLYQRNGIWWLSSDRKGAKIKPISLQTRDVTEALSRATAVRNTPDLNPADQLWGDAQDYIDEMWRTGKWTVASVDSKGTILKVFCKHVGQKKADKVTGADLQGWYDGLLSSYVDHKGRKQPGRSTNTANSYVSVVGSFFTWLVNKSRTRKNPADDLKRIKTDNTARYAFCTAEQRDKLIDNCKDQELKLILFLGFHAGLRKGEIVEAVRSWFDIENQAIHLTKTPTCRFKDREERSIPMTDEFAAFLRSYNLPNGFVIKPKKPARKSKQLLRYDPEKKFKAYVKSQGLEYVRGEKLTMHITRHTFASLLLQAGQSLYKVSRWMGDEERTVTGHYGHLKPSDDSINVAYRRPANRARSRSKGDRKRGPKASRPKGSSGGRAVRA